ncbi:MAG TPA: hypothetical protein VHE23_05345, partial [Candidatus Acidoferrales bacterium]|nr:hypothetical protein [Candidatus Acidoferrales bacterium]
LLRELAPVLGIRGAPAHWSVKQYPRAIPQYTRGHTELVQEIKKTCEQSQGLFLAGNYLEGPAVGACIDVARRAATAAQEYLQSRGA